MKQIIKLKDIFSTELYVRSKAAELNDLIDKNVEEVEFDFSDVSFMSRSFADELFNVMEVFKGTTFTYTHRNDVVEMMMHKVFEGRNRERERGICNPQILEFKDRKSLEEFLIAM